MRATILLLVTLLLATGPASAQVTALEQARSLEVTVQPLPGPVQPLTAPVATNVTVRVPCEAAGTPNDSNPVRVNVSAQPTGVVATLSPSTVYPNPDACEASENATVEANTTLLVQATKDAPALTPRPLTVTATAGNRTGTGNLTVEAAYFSVFDATTPRSTVTAPPQTHLPVPVELTNLGNDEVTVRIQVQRTNGLEVALPSPVNVPSLQQGAQDNTNTVAVHLQTPYRNGHVNTRDVVTLEVTAEHHRDPGLHPDTTTLSVLVHTKGWYAPGPSALAAGLAAVAGALLLRRHLPT